MEGRPPDVYYQKPLLLGPGMRVGMDHGDDDLPPQRFAPAVEAEKSRSFMVTPDPPMVMSNSPPQRSMSSSTPRETTAPSDIADSYGPESLDSLATVSYEEAEALYGCNAQDVEYFFRRKGVPHIGQALARNGVGGSSIHMLSGNDIENKLRLNLGQQLALKNFIRQMQAVSKRRVEKVWEAEEVSDKEEEVWQDGCCPCSWLFCYCACFRPPSGLDRRRDLLPTAKLRKAQYTLTNSELSIETWSWVDETLRDREVPLKQTANCGCGSVCGYNVEPTPQQCTTTNNIDIACIQDVDNRKFTAKAVNKTPTCLEFCCGYNEVQVTPAATLTVTFIDRGNILGARQGQQEVRVKPGVVQEVTRKIIAERDASTETSPNQHFTMNSSNLSDVM